MDLISLLYVSLGSSTVQLHDSLGSICACASSEVFSVMKILTVPEEYPTEEQRSILRFVVVGKIT
jgi:uncharacterized membrane protein